MNKAMLPIIMLLALLSGFRGGSFSTEHLRSGAPPIMLTLLLGWFGGAFLAPRAARWLPGNTPAAKGWAAGGLGLVLWPAACLPLHLEPLDVTLALLVIPSLTSLLASARSAPEAAATLSPSTRALHVAPLALASGLWIAARIR